jgi:hypothetical protein
MAGLTNKCREVIQNNPIGKELDQFRESYFEFVSKFDTLPSYRDIVRSAITDSGISLP